MLSCARTTIGDNISSKLSVQESFNHSNRYPGVLYSSSLHLPVLGALVDLSTFGGS